MSHIKQESQEAGPGHQEADWYSGPGDIFGNLIILKSYIEGSYVLILSHVHLNHLEHFFLDLNKSSSY